MPRSFGRRARTVVVSVVDFWTIANLEFIMPKQKTHKGIKKRFTVTATGKAKHRKAFRGHLLSSKNGKRKRNLRQDGVLDNFQSDRIVEALRPIL